MLQGQTDPLELKEERRGPYNLSGPEKVASNGTCLKNTLTGVLITGASPKPRHTSAVRTNVLIDVGAANQGPAYPYAGIR